MTHIKTVQNLNKQLFGHVQQRLDDLTLDDFKMHRLRLRKGDLVMLKTDLILDRDMVDAFRKNARELFAPARVGILTGDLKMSVWRKKKTT